MAGKTNKNKSSIVFIIMRNILSLIQLIAINLKTLSLPVCKLVSSYPLKLTALIRFYWELLLKTTSNIIIELIQISFDDTKEMLIYGPIRFTSNYTNRRKRRL